MKSIVEKMKNISNHLVSGDVFRKGHFTYLTSIWLGPRALGEGRAFWRYGCLHAPPCGVRAPRRPGLGAEPARSQLPAESCSGASLLPPLGESIHRGPRPVYLHLWPREDVFSGFGPSFLCWTRRSMFDLLIRVCLRSHWCWP